MKGSGGAAPFFGFIPTGFWPPLALGTPRPRSAGALKLIDNTLII